MSQRRLTHTEHRARRKARKELNAQRKRANIHAKYGVSGRPAAVKTINAADLSPAERSTIELQDEQEGDIAQQRREEEAEVAHGIELRIKEAIAAGRKALWELAEALYDFDEEKGYVKLGYESVSHWLADPDISMTESTYYRYVGTWRKLVVHRGVSLPTLGELDLSKVDIVLPAIETNSVLTEDALADAKALGARDLRAKYKAKPDKAKPEENAEEEDIVDSTATDRPGDDEPVRADEMPTEEDRQPQAEGESPDRQSSPPELPEGVELKDVKGAAQYLAEALDQGASHPRVSRRDLQTLYHLARVWLPD